MEAVGNSRIKVKEAEGNGIKYKSLLKHRWFLSVLYLTIADTKNK